MTETQLRLIWGKTHGHCHFCGDPIAFAKRGWREGDLKGFWEVDHVIQRGKGGSSAVDNCLPACTRCNRLRWHRTGAKLRELLELGLVAKTEIRKGTTIGQALGKLRRKRSRENIHRRSHFTLDQAFGSVKPLRRPKSLKQVRDIAIEEHVQRALKKNAL